MPTRPAATTATRLRVLDAGIDIWLREPPATLFGGYTVARVAKAAGVTRATFYSYWPSAADYMDDLLGHLADLDPEEFADDVESTVRSVEFAANDLTTPFLAGCDAQLRSVIDDPGLRVRLGFLSKMDDPEVAARLRHRYRTLEKRQWKAPERMLHSWGREVRPPIEPHQLVAMHSALQEFLAAHHVIDPEAVPVKLYGYVSLVLLLLLTRRIDDPRTVDDILGVADTWPAIGIQLLAQQAGDVASPRRTLEPETIRQMTVRARNLLASLPWEDLHLADVGRSVALNEELARRAFHTKAGLAVSILGLSISEHFDEMERTGDPATDLRRMIDLAAGELALQPELTRSVLMELARDTRFPAHDLMVWNPVPVVADQIRATVDAGQLDPEIDAEQLTATLFRVLLLDSIPGVRVRGEGPRPAELVLRGAGAAPC